MRRIWIPLLLVAGCAQLPPPPGDAEAKRFESVPGKSVIYVARQLVASDAGSTLLLDERTSITTFRGTYYRWEVEAGTHRITGFGAGGENVTLNTAPGKIYFLQHTVMTHLSNSSPILSTLREVDDQTGRNLVSRATLLR